MTEQKWTPEPWIVDYKNSHTGSIATCHGTERGWYEVWAPYSGGPFDQRANAYRIVDCVNAMQGIRNPSAVRKLVEAARAVNDWDWSGLGSMLNHADWVPALADIGRLEKAIAALDAEESR